MEPIRIPRAQAALAGTSPPDPVWYDVLRRIADFVNASGLLDAGTLLALEDRIAALEDAGGGQVVGPASVQVLGSLANGGVTLRLLNDIVTPGNTYYYGTGATGAKGWTAVSDTMAGADSVIQTVGADGISTFNLDGDDPAPGNGYSYATSLLSGAKGWFLPALFESTGVLMGGALSINAGDNTKFDVALAVIGSTDYTVGAANPQRHLSIYGPTLANTVPDLSVTATYIGIQMPAGTLVTSPVPFTSTQSRTIAQLGAVISNGTNLIAVNNLPSVIRAGINQIQDLMSAIGPINIPGGNVISPNGAGLDINKSAGTVFKQGANFVNNVDDPHKLTLAALTGASFNYRLSNGTQFATTTNIDPNNYESPLGTLTAVPAANRFTIQRITVFTSNLLRIQYGQFVYNTMAEAEASLPTEAFATEANIAENGILLCFMIVQDGATDLSDPAEAKFIPASKFGGAVGSGGTSITNTDALPEGVTNLYFTDARARAAVITATITNGDTTHSPSGDAVFDALAAKQPLDDTLSALAAANWALNAFPIGTGADTLSQVAFAANTFPARASTGNLVAKTITDGALSAMSGAAGDTVFLRGDGTAVNWINGDFRVGTSSGLFGSGREVVVSAGTSGDNISHVSMQGSRTTAGATFGAFQFFHQSTRVASLVGFRDGADDAGGFTISTKATGVAIANALRINGDGTVRPGADNTQDFGQLANRWMTSHVINQHQYGARFETGVVSPATLTANTDNWAVTGLSTAGVIRASTNASRNLTGIASPTSGQTFLLVNVGANDLVLVHDATSTAANRFLCPNSANLTLNPNDSVYVWYDNTSSRWRVIGT